MTDIDKKEEGYKILKDIDKLKNFSKNKLYIAENKLKKHLTENEILELLQEEILDDKTLI